MIRTPSILIALGVLCSAANATELAYAVRPTDLKAKPFSDAATVASLAERSRVEVLNRQSSWIEVKADANRGWVKMLSLRFEEIGAAGKGDSGGNAFLSALAKGHGGSVPTTGVRGLNEEDLTNPHPNAAALQEMNNYRVSDAEAQSFAKAGKLETQSMAYVDMGARK